MAQQRKQQGETSESGTDREGGHDALPRRPSSGEMSLWGTSPLRRALAELDWMFEQMQRNFFGEGRVGAHPMFERRMRFDMDETDDAVLVRAEIPGVDPNELHLECREGVLTLRAQSDHEEGHEERGGYARSHASFYQQVPLPPYIRSIKRRPHVDTVC